MQSERRILRRAVLGNAGLVIGALAAGGVPAQAVADQEIKETDKIKQTDAHYQRQPNGQQRCEICLQFLAPGKCKIVQGPVIPQGWCQFFAAKENAR